MIVLKLLGITLLVVAMFLYEFQKLQPGKKKEKSVFVVITSVGWGLAVLLMLVPGLPGPTELINYVFRPVWAIFYSSE